MQTIGSIMSSEVVAVEATRPLADAVRLMAERLISCVMVVAGPRAYRSQTGDAVEERSTDIVARVINPMRVHKAFAVSGVMCLGAAAAIRAR